MLNVNSVVRPTGGMVGEVSGVELILPLHSNLSILFDSSWLDASNLFNISRMAWPVDANIAD